MAVTVDGVERLIRAAGEMKKKDARAVEMALAFIAYRVWRRSQDLCPEDTGFLKESGKVEQDGTGLFADFYVVYSAYYAVYVHEDLSKHHPKGQAKFLEQAMREIKPSALATMAKFVREGDGVTFTIPRTAIA